MKSDFLEKLKNLLFALILVVLAILELKAQGRLNGFFSVFDNVNDINYYQVGMNAAGTYYALGVDGNGNEILSVRKKNQKTQKWSLRENGIPESFRPVDSYIGSNGDIFLGGRNQDRNELYLLTGEGNEPELLQSIVSLGDYHDNFSHISERYDGYSFTVTDETGSTAYAYDIYAATLTKGKHYPKGEPTPLATLPDGSVIVFKGTEFPDTEMVTLDPTVLLAAGTEKVLNNIDIYTYLGHCWILDKDTSDLWYYAQEKSGFVMNLKDSQYGNVISLTVAGAGAVILTDENRVFLKENPVSEEVLSDPLNERKPAWIRFILFCLGALFLVFVIYFLQEYDRRHRNSFVFRGVVFSLGIVMAVLLILELYVVRPVYAQKMTGYLQKQMETLIGQEVRLEEYFANAGEEADLTEFDRLEELLSGGGNEFMILHLSQKEKDILVERECGCTESVICTEFPGVYRKSAKTAFEKGTSFCEFLLRGRACYAYTKVVGEEALSVLTYSYTLSDLYQLYGIAVLSVFSGLLPVCLLVFFFLLSGLRKRINRLSADCDSFIEGNITAIVPDRQDEIGSLTLKMENAIREKNRVIRECEGYQKYYRSFLPEEILTTFGIDPTEKLVPGTSVEKEMILMKTELVLPKEVERDIGEEAYVSIGRSLAKIRQYIEKNGGLVLSYEGSGLEAVFPPDSGEALAAAVSIRQGVSILNKLTHGEEEGAELFIGLDRAMVRVGIIGDEKHMQLLSRHYTIMDDISLIKGFIEIRDFIVCTKEVMRPGKSVRNRWIGAYRDGKRNTDLYEVYEGDPYGIRLAKEYSQETFERGVRSYREENYPEARKCFLSVIGDNIKDATAVYYLQKTEDKMKKSAEEQDVTG